ncbi:conserved hypothetical protein [Candida dubliniensis CD36]|uniref:Uncharacterized protein n=1 Tax=Candida dubliniensis (strain CD36 / ATCC MYA-646 / CBS 7987 / NCPF 3949 / NRRL Y-17841) TaxID=573826 RepID=B9WHZ9_CANDC|nr:conserved hypothetical protein [Candida dubliniensis CD36]CAX41796.1 conserved hypothetical protein [Candida dubliniensis CD36]
MSDELGKVCDQILDETLLMSHKYGIPKVESSSQQSASNVKQLEHKYYHLYKQLNHKLNHLIYLNKLQELNQKSTQAELDTQLKTIKDQMGIESNQELLDFLKLQNNEIKTEKLLLQYLLMIEPILNSTHRSDLNQSEQRISKMLNELYNDDENDTGLVFQRIANRKNQNELQAGNYNLIKNVVKPIIDGLGELNKTLMTLNKQYVNKKQSQMEDDPEEGVKRKQYYELVRKWKELQDMVIEIPSLISDLPINWYDDPTLLQIMQEVDEIQIKLNTYQSIINEDTISAYTTTELLALEFPC